MIINNIDMRIRSKAATSNAATQRIRKLREAFGKARTMKEKQALAAKLGK